MYISSLSSIILIISKTKKIISGPFWLKRTFRHLLGIGVFSIAVGTLPFPPLGPGASRDQQLEWISLLFAHEGCYAEIFRLCSHQGLPFECSGFRFEYDIVTDAVKALDRAHGVDGAVSAGSVSGSGANGGNVIQDATIPVVDVIADDQPSPRGASDTVADIADLALAPLGIDDVPGSAGADALDFKDKLSLWFDLANGRWMTIFAVIGERRCLPDVAGHGTCSTMMTTMVYMRQTFMMDPTLLW